MFVKTNDMEYIAYYRVSTSGQGESGLGLESQREIVSRYCGVGDTILSEYTEVESGRNNNREQLGYALSACSEGGCTLLIAKLDRLSRNVSFTSMIMDSGIRFVACDIPGANEFTIHVMAAMAQQEAKKISERTCDALRAKKARGEKMGTPSNLTYSARLKGAASRRRMSLSRNRVAMEFVSLYLDKGLNYSEICGKLNSMGITTATGCIFRPQSVSRIVKLIRGL